MGFIIENLKSEELRTYSTDARQEATNKDFTNSFQKYHNVKKKPFDIDVHEQLATKNSKLFFLIIIYNFPSLKVFSLKQLTATSVSI